MHLLRPRKGASDASIKAAAEGVQVNVESGRGWPGHSRASVVDEYLWSAECFRHSCMRCDHVLCLACIQPLLLRTVLYWLMESSRVAWHAFPCAAIWAIVR